VEDEFLGCRKAILICNGKLCEECQVGAVSLSETSGVECILAKIGTRHGAQNGDFAQWKLSSWVVARRYGLRTVIYVRIIELYWLKLLGTVGGSEYFWHFGHRHLWELNRRTIGHWLMSSWESRSAILIQNNKLCADC
jgi:hypothetical protein